MQGAEPDGSIPPRAPHAPRRAVLRDVVKLLVGHVPPAVVRRLGSPMRERLLWWIQASLERWPRSFTARTTDGFLFTGSTRDIIQRFVFVYGVWEPETTAWVRGFLRPGDVALDVGANCGYYSLLFASRVGSAGAVVAVEAVPSIFELLEANLRLNGGANVRAHLAAAGEEDGEVEIFRADPATLGWSGTRPSAGAASEGRVSQRRLDGLLDDDERRRLALVKIDTEGDELRALRGMTELLERPGRLALLVELTPEHLAERGQDVTEILDLLAAYGFRPFTLGGRGLVPLAAPPREQTDAVFLRDQDGAAT